jgi:Bardet-Biedl syndrome 7 protein
MMNEIRMKGPFTKSDIHGWISKCLPEVPPFQTDDEQTLIFRSTFINTYIVCIFKKAHCVIRSDSYSALTIIKVTQL